MTPVESEVIVAWREVRKTYPNGFAALDGVSLDVRRGEVVALLGTSGSGKTTLLKLVNRLIEPTSGDVIVEGRSVSDWDPLQLRRAIGYVIQEVGLMPHLDVSSNVSLGLRIRGMPRGAREEVARSRLSLVGLDPDRFGPLHPHQLSGGQRQRVGVARALAADPHLILMDEPFGALDPVLRRDLQDEFRALRRRLGMTVILVTHDIREACRLADRLVLMDHGRLVQLGTAEEMMTAPATEFVRAFFQEAEAVAIPTDRR
jgi:osmoprotectant transport system ATP-binding protein